MTCAWCRCVSCRADASTRFEEIVAIRPTAITLPFAMVVNAVRA